MPLTVEGSKTSPNDAEGKVAREGDSREFGASSRIYRVWLHLAGTAKCSESYISSLSTGITSGTYAKSQLKVLKSAVGPAMAWRESAGGTMWLLRGHSRDIDMSRPILSAFPTQPPSGSV